jgi:hypothetical protein
MHGVIPVYVITETWVLAGGSYADLSAVEETLFRALAAFCM